jgi:putative transposase
MGLEAVYPKPDLSRAAEGHRIYPYLLKGVEIHCVNQVWSTDITYIRMAHGFVYLVAVMDWFSRFVLSWTLSLTMELDFWGAALKSSTTIKVRRSPAVNSPASWRHGRSRTAIEGRGRGFDNIFIERLWRSLKYEGYLKDYQLVTEAGDSIKGYFRFYNYERPRQRLDYRTPVFDLPGVKIEDGQAKQNAPCNSAFGKYTHSGLQ